MDSSGKCINAKEYLHAPIIHIMHIFDEGDDLNGNSPFGAMILRDN